MKQGQLEEDEDELDEDDELDGDELELDEEPDPDELEPDPLDEPEPDAVFAAAGLARESVR